MGVIRMVRSWNEWLAIWGYDINAGAPQLTDDAAEGTVSDLIGDQLRAYTNSFPFVVDGERYVRDVLLHRTRVLHGRRGASGTRR